MCKLTISESPLTENPNDQIKVRDERWRRNLKSKYIKIDTPFENIFRVVSSDYRTYSAGFFKDNYAKNENWMGQEMLILDIDDGLPIVEAIELFKDYKAMIHTSASHQKDKGGNKCDRYRVIIPTKYPITCTVKEYTATMKYISKKVFPFIDEKCVDPARIYFGHFGCDIFYTDGLEKFDFYKYNQKVKKLKEIESERISQKPTPIKREYTQGENVIDNFNRDHSISEILSRNGYKEIQKRWLSPLSSTGIAGVILSTGEDGKEWAYNHHSSDNWENSDAYGIYCELEFAGDHKKACEALKTHWLTDKKE